MLKPRKVKLQKVANSAFPRAVKLTVLRRVSFFKEKLGKLFCSVLLSERMLPMNLISFQGW